MGWNRTVRSGEVPPRGEPVARTRVLHEHGLHHTTVGGRGEEEALFLATYNLTTILLVINVILLYQNYNRARNDARGRDVCNDFTVSSEDYICAFHRSNDKRLQLSNTPCEFHFTLSNEALSVSFRTRTLAGYRCRITCASAKLRLATNGNATARNRGFALGEARG